MLTRSTRTATLSLKRSLLRSSISVSVVSKLSIVRFQSTLPETPKEVFTNIFEENDPSRQQFFEYTWGTWLKDDKLEKAKRRTEFSIKGLNDTLMRLSAAAEFAKLDEPLTEIAANTFAVRKNLDLIGEGKFDNVKQIVSIHEGKHHRVYKFQMEDTSETAEEAKTPREYILRLPYKLDSSLYVGRKIQSEAATIDFLQSKLGLNVPKVIAYSASADNQLGAPFMILEYIPGSLLMKEWNPLIQGAINEPESKEKLMSVIGPIADFNKQVTSLTFNHFGSLYFKQDCPIDIISEENQEIYEGENEDIELKGRWVIGPTVEKAFYKNKNAVKQSVLDQHVGPWPKEEPLKMITDLVRLELESFKTRLALAKAGSSPKLENQGVLIDAIKTYEKLLKISNDLFNLKSETIPNLQALIKPRLSISDLDPMNAIVNSNKNNEVTFVDFEGSSIKPYLLTDYPTFLQYSGPKIFNLSEEIEGYDEMDEMDKQQYEFMFNRSRNQFYWELSLNDRSKKLLGVISPAVKLIKSPYSAALDLSNDKDFLYVQNGLVELSSMWEMYKENQLIGENAQPVEFTEDELKLYEQSLQNYQVEISATPFVATKGWVPQDMFGKLLEQGMIVKDGDDYKLDTEKVLE
ncbi:hypothetical protein CANARDRAFT_197271 [[Candida] arabinofermentans NRRL YB-2248]|uniref:Altered inheritance of mitochondria protein 9, mitochondrial n=1 Tax=[Candida] arabinofermentans NRRL YB-2248 TaxID=983967 RepID=A0A1E4T3K8_9ASCO|nr:hypothetical protein CANARDRAFT_197271 [[Candida] arabinofermentans NRRL YB-2248]